MRIEAGDCPGLVSIRWASSSIAASGFGSARLVLDLAPDAFFFAWRKFAQGVSRFGRLLQSSGLLMTEADVDSGGTRPEDRLATRVDQKWL